MQYYAKVNTADPRVGFLCVGDVLTDEQAAALGEEKLKELKERDVLGRYDEPDDTPAPLPYAAPMEPEAAPDAEDAEDGEEALPELGLDGLVKDEATSAEAPKSAEKRGRRKTK